MNAWWRATLVSAGFLLSVLSISQVRAPVQFTPAESRQALDAAIKSAMAFELPPGLSRRQIGIVDRVIASLRRGDKPGALKTWRELLDTEKNLLRGDTGDIMGLLFYVFRESIMDNSEDNKYWLAKLKTYNAISKALSDYLKELAGASATLTGKDGTVEVDAVSIRGAGENVTVRRASRRAMNGAELRAETDLARKAANSTEYELTKAQSLLKQDLSRDRELLKKLLDTLQSFEAETKKKLQSKTGQRPPPAATTPA